MDIYNTNVFLRERTIASGKTQLYLEYYDLDGKRRTKGIGITLDAGNDRSTKRENMIKRERANEMRSQLERELNDIASGKTQTNYSLRFVDYMKELASQKDVRTRNTWNLAVSRVIEYAGNDSITFRSVSYEWLKGLKSYLKNDCYKNTKHEKLSNNSASVIFSKVLCAVTQAYKDGIIDHNPALQVGQITKRQTDKSYLTKDELERLIDTPCVNDVVKRAFIFSCMTGMRISDDANLMYEDIRNENGKHVIVLKQQKTFEKTGRIQYVELNDLALKMVGEGSGYVFPKLTSQSSRYSITKWMESAGIKKDITFHSSRHTFATLTLTLSKDIYVTSKLLGHADVSTTQIYAHLLDEEKQRTLNGLSDLFNK